MKRLGLLLLATAAVACGDNSDECGPGTTAVSGLCTPDGSGAICGDGTTLDTMTGDCVIDPTSCGGGTVLVNGTCQDPTAGLTIDLEEAPEPNGLDAGSHSAGTIALKPIGDPKGFVVHGCVKPVSDTADLDAYQITVAAPTLIDITADGVQGLAAGFVTLADPNDADLSTWQRFGINLANDMSHREIYLPKGGTYAFVMSDTRSLLGLVDGATDLLEPAGNPDGTSCYYVTLKQEAIPTAATLPIPGGITAPFDGNVHFYSAQMPNGYIDMVESFDSTHAGPAMSFSVSDQFRALDNAGELFFSGINPTDTTVVVADFVYNYGIEAANYTITFNSASSAQALPTDGSTINSTINGKTFAFPAFSTVNEYYFDATAADQLFGMDITFSATMQGSIADEAGTFYGTFGGLTSPPGSTFTAYNGLWRAPHAGRFYFIVFDPTTGAANDVGAAFTLTGTLTALTPGAVVVGTPLVAEAVNAFDSNPYTLDITSNVWDSFNATGTNTGNVKVTVFDPAVAFGRLDSVKINNVATAGTVALISFNFPAAGAVKGYITKSLGINNVLVAVNAVTPTTTPTFTLDFAARTYTDLMDVVAPHTATTTGETVAAGDFHRYYFTTTPGNKVTITAHPTVVTDNPVASVLKPDETIKKAGNGAGIGADEVISYVQDSTGYTAFQVSNALAAVAMTYDLTIDVQPPFYTKHTGATTYADACTGGTNVTLTDTDEGYSAAIAAPAGFTFYGNATTQFKISSNGFITFNAAATGTSFAPAALPDGVGKVNIAPFWQDLENTVVCTKTVGTKFVVQWTGDEFNTGLGVQFQAVLDPADGSIEFVYGPNHMSDGTSVSFQGLHAIAGVQAAPGDQATQTGNGSVAAFATANTAVKLTHP
jgi:hypothetical protein